jgi:hypothetical protein
VCEGERPKRKTGGSGRSDVGANDIERDHLECGDTGYGHISPDEPTADGNDDTGDSRGVGAIRLLVISGTGDGAHGAAAG